MQVRHNIAGGLDHVSPIIRLPIERGINYGTRIGTMAEVDINTLTMEQYLVLSRENQAPGVVKPEIKGHVNFEIKSQFMQELREETFSRNKNEDARDHVDRVLNIVTLFNILKVSHDAVLLRVFSFTLTTSLSSISNTDGLAVIVSKLDKLGRDMKNLKGYVYAIQVGCQICEGPHFDKECPLNEEVKHMEEAKYGEFGIPALFNESNGEKYCVGPPGYYTRTNNRPPYGEKRPSLEELMNKHLEESARRSMKMKECIKKLQEKMQRLTLETRTLLLKT
nr:zinc knuckle CX2CX4HX4C [Tanacetum cinerariifolium]